MRIVQVPKDIQSMQRGKIVLLGMMAVTIVTALVLAGVANRPHVSPHMQHKLNIAASVITVAFGLPVAVAHQILGCTIRSRQQSSKSQ